MNIDKSKAMVTTSKFLEIKKETMDNFKNASRPSIHVEKSTIEAQFDALMDGFNKLCDLLHELIMEEND